MPAYKKEALTKEQWDLVYSVEETLGCWSRKWTPSSLKKNAHAVQETYDVLLYYTAKAALRFDKAKGFAFITYLVERVAYARVCRYWRSIKLFQSLDEPLGADFDRPLSDTISSPDYDSDDPRLADYHSALRYLSDRERMIVEHWHGLAGRERLGRSKIGSLLGITGSRAWQIYDAAIRKIRISITK